MNPLSLNSKLIVLGAFIIGALMMWLLVTKPTHKENAQFPMIALEKMGHLVSVKVNYSDVIEFTEKRNFDIPWTQLELRFGGNKVLLIAKGDCMIGTDLRYAKYLNTNTESRTVDVHLKIPKPIYARINHDSKQNGGSYLYEISSYGIEPIIPNSSNRIKAINNVYRFAEKEIKRTCNQVETINSAKINTEKVLSQTFIALGWKAKFIWQ